MTDLRPRIGITTRHDVETDRFYLARFYGEAVEAAGGIPLYLPLIPRADYLSCVVRELDGLLLPGSASDVDPLRYGHEPHPKLGSVHPLRDEMDLQLLKAAEKTAMPVLAICFGMQALNVYRGGTLVQDIEHQVANAVKHEQGSPRDRRSHQVRLAETSKLAALNGHTEALVNSHHHQGVEIIGRDLVASAWTADGLVEGLEDPRPIRFIIGVQWHPEIAWESDALSISLFRSFVAASSIFRSSANSASDNESSGAESQLRHVVTR